MCVRVWPKTHAAVEVHLFFFDYPHRRSSIPLPNLDFDKHCSLKAAGYPSGTVCLVGASRRFAEEYKRLGNRVKSFTRKIYLYRMKKKKLVEKLKNSEPFTVFCPFSSPILLYLKRRRIFPARFLFEYVSTVLQNIREKSELILGESAHNTRHSPIQTLCVAGGILPS